LKWSLTNHHPYFGGLLDFISTNWLPLGKEHWGTYVAQVVIGLIFVALSQVVTSLLKWSLTNHHPYFLQHQMRTLKYPLILIPATLTAVVVGITEPLEFTFLFIAPYLFVLHAVVPPPFYDFL
jgi:phosphotransferase system  glucose/maltose/N-acetylglucosamine-specific IIC component